MRIVFDWYEYQEGGVLRVDTERGTAEMMHDHVACYDLPERRCSAQIDCEEAGLNAVFGICSAD